MTPRAYAKPGLRGPGQDVFPEDAKQHGRDLGLTEDATILKNEATDDGGGSKVDNWIVQESEIPGRVDPLSTVKSSGIVAGQVNEESTHVISLDPKATVSTKSRIEIDGKTWAVTAQRERTDELIIRVEAKGV